MTMAGGKLTICYRDGCLFIEVQRSEGRLYLMKLSIVDQCLIVIEDTAEDWLWHSRFGHLSFHTLKEMSSKKLVEGLPPINIQVSSAEIVLSESTTGCHSQKRPPFERLSR